MEGILIETFILLLTDSAGVQFGSPHFKRGVNLLERIERKATK